ncbi:YdcF family protein [Coleofasciculus sp. LEGE 07081]|uniref:YdcF family protein n=1 Tax=Coleofasciculus sp. LEGE 07081 TaxID=2777967 RepID=UPI0034DB59D4
MCAVSTVLILILLSIIPLRLAIAYSQAPHPQAILTLGGGVERETFTAQFAQAHPTLDIWVSSGIPSNKARPIFRAAGINDERVHLDRRAVDTVTNFTSLVPDFKRRHIQHLYLITSDYHMPRATAIAILVLGSQGIAFTPVSVPSNIPTESSFRLLRDVGRAFLWVVTGHTGASLNPRLSLSPVQQLYHSNGDSNHTN